MAQQGLQPQQSMHFLGVNLHSDRLSLADQEMARAINADFHTEPGTCILRKGRSRLFSEPLLQTSIRRLAKIDGRRYQVAGPRLFRDQVSIAADIGAFAQVTFVAFKPLTDPLTWAFFADESSMRKDRQDAGLQRWGIEAPTVAPTFAAGAAGSLTGDYSVVYTYARKYLGSLAHESNPSPASATVALTSDVGAISGLLDSGDPQVTHKRIYRTLSNADGLWLFDQEIAQGVTTATTSQADSLLGSSVEFDNDPPPTAKWIVEYQGSIFLLADNRIYWTKRYRPESVPPENFVEIGSPSDPLLCGVTVAGVLGVLTRTTKYRITGDTVNGFVPIEALSKRGTPSPAAVIATEGGAVIPALDGIFITNFIDNDQRFSELIDPLFFGETVNDYAPIDWGQASQFSAAYYKQRYYFSYAEHGSIGPNRLAVYSFETKHWYFYTHAVGSLLVEPDVDILAAGGLDGLVYVLEDGQTDDGNDILFEAESKDYSGSSPYIKKLLFSVRLDLDTAGQDVTAEVYVDGLLKRSATVNSSRGRTRVRLPEGTIGYSWRVKIRFEGRQRVRWYGLLAQWIPLEVAA